MMCIYFNSTVKQKEILNIINFMTTPQLLHKHYGPIVKPNSHAGVHVHEQF